VTGSACFHATATAFRRSGRGANTRRDRGRRRGAGRAAGAADAVDV